MKKLEKQDTGIGMVISLLWLLPRDFQREICEEIYTLIINRAEEKGLVWQRENCGDLG